MSLLQIRVNHFRNLGSVDISPSPTPNFLYGVNGSGKTSLLEALSVLAHGRSFRTRKFRRLIQEEQHEFTAFGRISGEGGQLISIGVSRRRSGERTFRVDGTDVSSSAELAARLPLLVLNAESFGLLIGSPKQRRQFFDWLVFHVKPEFRTTWRAYSRCVKQRNSLLRHDKIAYSEVRPWDLEIAKLSNAIERDRRACIHPLMEEFAAIEGELDIGGMVELEYLSGWRSDDAFAVQLEESFVRDRKLGYTSLGPHKSDLKITARGLPAGEVLSRGQQKSLIAALYVAEARTFTAANKAKCVFLIDDMPAELDSHNIARVGRWINDTQAQVFVTSVEHQSIEQGWPNLALMDPKLFHVEHGTITETTPGL